MAYQLGELGCSLDMALALHYYRLAAYRGIPEAAYNLSGIFLDGYPTIIEKNELLALKYAKLAASQGYPLAELGVGYWYETVSQDMQQAKQWYNLAAEHGIPEARKRLEELDPPSRFIAIGIDIGTV